MSHAQRPSLSRRLRRELVALSLAALYFGCWLTPLVVVKQLILEEYQIPFRGLTMAAVGTLILSKVVLVLEHVPLGAWVGRRAAWVDVLLRTGIYALGVLGVLILEKAFEGRHERGGLVPALQALFHQADVYHVWVNTIVISGALLGYNLLSVLRRRLGAGGLRRLFLTPLGDGDAGR